MIIIICQILAFFSIIITWFMRPESGISLFLWDIFFSSISLIFSSIYMVELILKMFAKSLFIAKRSFFRKLGFWNTIDFVIIITSFIYCTYNFLDYFVLGVFSPFLADNDSIIGDFFRFYMKMHTGSNLGRFEAPYRLYGVLGICQFLLPIRGLLFIPLVRVMIESMVSTVPFLASILFLTFLVIAIFSLLGMSSFMGVFHRRCVNPNKFIDYFFQFS